MDKQFLNEQNLNILQEILFQELKISANSSFVPQIKQIFINNIHFFLQNANMNNSLIELNKLFLRQTILAINKLIPNLKNEIKNKKINIISDDINFFHKVEDLKNIKLELFNEEFNLKREEFNATMKNEVPNTLNFSDNYVDEKITDMNKILSEKISQRNSEIPLSSPSSSPSPSPQENEQKKIKKVNFDLSDNIDELKRTQYEVQFSAKLPPDISSNNILYDNEEIQHFQTPINELPITMTNKVPITMTNELSTNELIKKMFDKMEEITKTNEVMNQKLDLMEKKLKKCMMENNIKDEY